MKKIILSQKDYEFFVEYCNKEPNPETLAKLKKLFDKTSPWDATLSDGLEEWEWDLDDPQVKKEDEETEDRIDKALGITRGDDDE
jgi:hypothetical protein